MAKDVEFFGGPSDGRVRRMDETPDQWVVAGLDAPPPRLAESRVSIPKIIKHAYRFDGHAYRYDGPVRDNGHSLIGGEHG